MSLFHKFRNFTLEWGWEEIVPSSGSEPSGNRGSAVFCRDGTSNNFCLVGGRNQAGTDRTDYWRFDLGTKQWTQVVASGLANVVIPSGYADGAGNILIAGNGRREWASNVASTQLSKINVSTGAQVALTDGGTGTSESQGSVTADIANKTVYFAASKNFDYQAGQALAKGVQSTAGNTNTKSTFTSAATGRSQESNPAYYPAGNALYMLAPSRAYNSGAWNLGAGDILKYDLTAATGWVAETGVTNNAGAVPMPAWPGAVNQLVWCAAESKFFLFVAGGGLSYPGGCAVARVLTYDPASKVIAEALYSGQPSAYLLGGQYEGYTANRGNCGTVVVTASDFFFITAFDNSAITNARIWKFRRN